jgi:protoporphyrinogen oxidase
MGVGLDIIRKPFSSAAGGDTRETFSSILQQGLGKTICEEFYFPYARKIWGLEPEAISPTQAQKRVSAGSIGKMIRRLLPGGGAGGGASTRGVFYYPRHGYGQISQALCDAAVAAGARVQLNTRVEGINIQGERPQVEVVEGDESRTITSDQIFSTIPVTMLTKLVDLPVPDDVLQAAAALGFRSMVLVYLLLDQDRFTEFDAHYFPGEEYPFTRLSETRNYTDLDEPRGRTVVCAELPCFQDDEVWKLSDAQLGGRVTEGLTRAGLPVTTEILDVRSKRIPFAYPLFRVGYEKHFSRLDDWVDNLDGLLSYGRQGLFAHDNTHHAIYMAQAAVRCLRDDGKIDAAAWQAQREIFDTHVVED